MTEIKKVAVLGSGVMGSGIAAHIANAGVPVLLLDIVPEGATDRNQLANGALEKLAKVKPAALSHPKKIKLITAGNLEDDLDKLAEVDWIIEAVLERPDVKHAVYQKVDAVRKPGSIVSSNTSTLPLKALVHGQSEQFRKDFLITHFFNPPRYMRLLEVVGSADVRPAVMQAITHFGDVKLGKGVVQCKDTPGFIANRIGIYWMMVGLLEAIKLGISVEEADAVMGRPAGIPKTGVFGLFDLVGIDLMPHIGKAMLQLLPPTDSFHGMYQEPDLIKKMISEGYTGRKGKGGFYRLNKSEDGKKTKEAIDLKTGDYRKEKKAALASVDAAKAGLRALVMHEDIGGKYAHAVLLETLRYAASLVPEISDDLYSIDQAMKTGFNWKYGPFELIDRLGNKKESGTAWFAAQLAAAGKEVPAILKAANGRPFYDTQNGKFVYLTLQGEYTPIKRAEGVFLLADVKLAAGNKPIIKNGSAALWDIGDGIALFEFTSKANSIDPDLLTLLAKSLEVVKANYKGLVIGGDGDNFSVGANLGFMLYAANMAAWPLISDVIKQGQQVYMAMKYAPFPTVAAVHGYVFGGGCEMMTHTSHVQAHLETYSGLVEVGVGLIPGWGGCKEQVIRNVKGLGLGGAMPGISKAFENIATAKVSESADLAYDNAVLRPTDSITMNRDRLLADAKAAALKLAENYTPPEPQTVHLPGLGAWAALNMAVDNFVANGQATKHDAVVSRALATILTGGDVDPQDELTEQHLLDLEHDVFMKLVRHPDTLDRIEHMLLTNKPLRN
ncbi:MAG: 3-hydroxyacyl-CoA dehydrogenase [Alphaproteobacteria bacterium]|nr:3-hydroxyacyl-CoA dehydrogenase [Alphaproteobacteria bacterium]